MSGIKTVVVHPLVLLSVVDHYNRVCGEIKGFDRKKRVVGILLGTQFKGTLDITNSYAVPFEEDPETPDVWYLDHNYHENMFDMFKKVNAKEKVIGWYSTGPKIRPADLDINELIRRYTPNPVLVIVDVNPRDDLELPTEAYQAVENAPEEKSKHRRTFQYLPCEIGALEAEEVGVEHLLRNIRDQLVGTLADQVAEQLASLKGLKKRMVTMADYLDNVCAGKLPVNHQIIYDIQNMINLRPDLRVKELVKAFAVLTNDNMLVIYLSSLIRSILALHNLINNKLHNRDYERKLREKIEGKDEDQDKEKEKEDKAKEDDKAKEGDKLKENDKAKLDDKEKDKNKKGNRSI